MKELFQHTAITDNITVRVAVNYLPEQSRAEVGKWFWAYHIRSRPSTWCNFGGGLGSSSCGLCGNV